MSSGVYIRTEYHKKRLKENHVGMLGKKQSKETIEKRSSKLRGKKRLLSLQHIQNIQVANIKRCKGNPAHNKGIPSSEESKLKNRLSHLGKKRSKESIKKQKENAKITLNRPEIKAKMRQKAVQRVLLNNGKFPSYSKKQVEYFKNYDKKNNANGQYATHPHEYYIKELGYWPDYINFDKKIIMEYDEKYHFNKSTGLLKEQDIQRQQEIQEKYPDFEFIRVNKDKI